MPSATTETPERTAQKYSFAPDVERVAERLIAEHHQHLSKETGIKILYLFTEEPEKVRGREALGVARKVSGLNGFLVGSFAQMVGESNLADYLLSDWSGYDDTHSEFFVMTIYKSAWLFILSEKQKVALIDHELSHFGVKSDKDGNIRLTILPHDSEEFIAIVKRHGPWSSDVAAIIKAAQVGPQLTFEQIAERGVDRTERQAA